MLGSCGHGRIATQAVAHQHRRLTHHLFDECRKLAGPDIVSAVLNQRLITPPVQQKRKTEGNRAPRRLQRLELANRTQLISHCVNKACSALHQGEYPDGSARTQSPAGKAQRRDARLRVPGGYIACRRKLD